LPAELDEFGYSMHVTGGKFIDKEGQTKYFQMSCVQRNSGEVSTSSTEWACFELI